MKKINKWVSTVKKIFLNPEKFYAEKEISDSPIEPLKFAGITFAVITTFLCILSGIALMNPFLYFGAVIIGPVGGFILGIVITIVYSLLLHIFILIFQGKKFQKTLEIVSYSLSLVLFAWIPVLNAVLPFYFYYVQVRGIEKMHNMKRGRSLLAAIVPIIILIFLSFFLYPVAVLVWVANQHFQ